MVVEESPKEAPPEAPAEPQVAMSTSLVGEGGLAGLGGPGSKIGGGSGNGIGGGGKGTKFGWYAAKVQKSISDALQRHPKTRTASISFDRVRVWADATGRITRVKLPGSTGNPELDAALQNDVLAGLQLSEPPPADMPMPINMRISSKKPGNLAVK